ncbi:LLM class flavin-dependent oxidoreductase [Candidatus Poriferisocius sp.]|uniref:LLM class flavin-dependent oxidoreductase n=1 Tax=Candidatus Poriferisocius sp. TaxID=3101276 RepID=UPI003B025A88
MTNSPVAITMPVEDGLPIGWLTDLVVDAEQAGIDTALVGEVAGPEAFATLGAMAARTQRIRLGSGIVAAYTRSPALTAMGFATLASLAPGRIVAGIGASSPIVVGRWHGGDFEQPLATVREFIGLLRAALAGEKLNHDGPRFRSKGFRIDLPPVEVPIWLGAINPRMLAMAGEIADAVFMTWCPPSEVAPKRKFVEFAAAEAGRDPAEVSTVLSFWAYSGPEPEQAMERMRRQVLAYAMVPTHQPAFVDTFENLPEVAEAWHKGDRAKALSLVPDEAVLAQCTLGPDMLAKRIDTYRAAGVDLPIVLLTGAHVGDDVGPQATVDALSHIATP